MAIENTSQDLADLLVTKGFDPVYTDERGMDSSQPEAKVFSFDWKASSGKNYGTAVIVLGEDNDLQFFFGDNLGRSIERPQDKKEWFDFLEQLSNFATQRRHTFSPKDINQLKHTMTGMAAIKEGLFEGYYGTRRISYMGEQTDARLVIKHNKVLGENDKRYRYVESLFIETADNERFKLPFKNLTGGRAMLEHVRQGGKPYDIRGAHINEMVQEMSVLARFNRASQQRVFEGVTAELVESAQHYYQQVRENLNYLGSSRGYRSYFESWTPADIGDETALVEDLKTMFIEQTLDTRIEAALPTLARIQQRGNAMKEAQIFENWINNLAEGTWALPDTPEAQEKLNTLMGSELIVGPDATNATELLYDVIGDDQLFDILRDLADKDPRANIWDDSDVQARLAELGIQTPQSTQAEPADVAQDTAPKQGVAEGIVDTVKSIPGKASAWLNSPIKGMTGQSKSNAVDGAMTGLSHSHGVAYAEDQLDEFDIDTLNQLASHPMAGPLAAAGGAAIGGAVGKGIKKTMDYFTNRSQKKADAKMMQQRQQQGMAEGSESPEKEIERLKLRQNAEHGGASLQRQAATQARIRELEKQIKNKQGVAENTELNTMLKYAGVPVKESVLTDSTGHTLGHILQRFSREVADFEKGGDLDQDLYEALYDYYFDDMPYGTKKARDGDPYEWVSERLADELGVNESNSGMVMPEADPMDTFEVMSGFDTPAVHEGSCNSTMEGEYCPEHGLAECAMESKVAGGMAPVIGEGETVYRDGLYRDDSYAHMEPKAALDFTQTDTSSGVLANIRMIYTIAKDGGDVSHYVQSLKKLEGSVIKGGDPRVQKPYKFIMDKANAGELKDPRMAMQVMDQASKMLGYDNIVQDTRESKGDAINHNGAITGSYYESKEGDAVLARIKSLALLK